MLKKIKLGQYFTKSNPFLNKVFEDWLKEAFYFSENNVILEPFIGNEDIIKLLKQKYHNIVYKGFDIDPKNKKTVKRNTLKNYPKNYDIVITNPPYLAKNSATRKNIPWEYDQFDDLYKVSLNKMLENSQIYSSNYTCHIDNKWIIWRQIIWLYLIKFSCIWRYWYTCLFSAI